MDPDFRFLALPRNKKHLYFRIRLRQLNGQLDAIQEGFWEEHGLQCGYCTPGMILSSYDLLERSPSPSDAEIRENISGNLCRCTGYQHIVNAVKSASRKRSKHVAARAGVR